MTRLLLTACVFLLGVSLASADYILIKINLNKVNLQADTIVLPGAGGQPATPAPQPPGTQEGAPAVAADDPDARWIHAFVEIKGKAGRIMNATPPGSKIPVYIYQYEHRWAPDKKAWFPLPDKNSPLPVVVHNFPPAFLDPLKDFSVKLVREKANRDKTIEGILHLARLALQHGSVKQFHKAMKEAADANPKHPVVKQYMRVKKELERPFSDKDIDPTQEELLKALEAEKHHVKVSDQKHYAIWFKLISPADRLTEATATRRLKMLENTLETFYYWFAIQKETTLQPALPRYRFQVLLTTAKPPDTTYKEEFLTRNLQWGFEPIVGDGFATRRDNIIVMSAKTRLDDPLYQDFESLLNHKLKEINAKLQALNVNVTVTREDLLSGKVNERPLARFGAIPVAYAQTAVVLARALEDEAERLTTTNQAVRQILIASQIFPRHVQIPDWMVEGLAAFFETSPGLYPSIGAKSWTHLVSYKHLRNLKDRRLENPSTALFNLVTDRWFQEARAKSANLRQSPNNVEFRLAARDAWELARCTSWAFVYYLAQTQKLDLLFKFGKELNELPRDMDLTELVIQTCFARAFEMTDNADPRRIDQAKLAETANAWTGAMSETNLDNISVQEVLLKIRASQEGPTAPAKTADASDQSNLAGSTWNGTETFSGGGKLGFTFQAGGAVTISKATPATGTWTQTGDKVTINAGNISYSGTLAGNNITGTAANGQASWTFTVSRAGPRPSRRPGG